MLFFTTLNIFSSENNNIVLFFLIRFNIMKSAVEDEGG